MAALNERPPSKRRPNADERRALKAAEVHRFTTLYGRKAQKGVEPNDRRYNRDTERSIRRMPPDEFDRVLHDDED